MVRRGTGQRIDESRKHAETENVKGTRNDLDVVCVTARLNFRVGLWADH